jgi:hypothetical protein
VRALLPLDPTVFTRTTFRHTKRLPIRISKSSHKKFHFKNKDGVDFRYFWKCHHFKNVWFELGAIEYSRLPIFILVRFWEIRKFLTNGLRESPCMCSCNYFLNISVIENLICIVKLATCF